MTKSLRKDYTGAGGAGLGVALAILVVGALRQWAGVEMGALEVGALTTVCSFVVSLAVSRLTPLTDDEQRTIVARRRSRLLKED